MTDAFITLPNFRIQQHNQNSQSSTQAIKPKIIAIIKSFIDQQILHQAINNIAIPKHFVDIQYINSRPQSEMPKIYNIVCALKKEIHKLKKSPIPQPQNKVTNSEQKNIQNNTARSQQKQANQKSYQFTSKPILLQQKIKQAIIKQLQDRQKLQAKKKKIETADKIKSQFLQKRKQTAKLMNKKAVQLYERQRENQQREFQSILESKFQSNNDNKNQSSESFVNDFSSVKSTSQIDHNFQLVKQRRQKFKNQFETYLQQQNQIRVQKEKSQKQFKHRRLNSLNQQAFLQKVKSQQIIQRKIAAENQQQTRKINNFLQKQIKFNQLKKDGLDKENRKSQMTQTHTLNNSSFFRFQESRSVDFDKQNQKQAKIFQKLSRKNQLKQEFLSDKVLKIKLKNKMKEQKVEAFKESQIKFITEANHSESFVYQNNMMATRSSFASKKLEEDAIHEEKIKKKHEKMMESLQCEENILKMRRLPKQTLMMKLKRIKNKEITDILAANIVKLIK